MHAFTNKRQRYIWGVQPLHKIKLKFVQILKAYTGSCKGAEARHTLLQNTYRTSYVCMGSRIVSLDMTLSDLES